MVRRAIHVGNLTFNDGSKVERHLLQDIMKSIKPWLGVLMDNYRVRRPWDHALWLCYFCISCSISSICTNLVRLNFESENISLCPLSQSFHIWSISSYTQVLIYSGQLDVIVAAPLTERFLPTINWTGAAEYKTAPRFHWRVQPSDTEVAGYVRQVKEFYQVSTY